MTLEELKKAIDVLYEDEDKRDDPVCLEALGTQFELAGISVVVASDLWLPETVVVSVEEILESADGD